MRGAVANELFTTVRAVKMDDCKVLIWRAVRDDFRNWFGLGLGGPRKGMKIGATGQNDSAGSGEIESSHGASEAEQLFDPERA
jgi:hypothetical protein